ncbi:hypothetical protein Fmac_018912 [Flemingia macrophylla]|uniref:DNA polymerase delta subunit 3 n=1 Tax=Flemingia macrophylla TaxID=520843 RepID=A0ABD1M6E5_9FABA
MAQTQNPSFIHEIESLVSDKLQVVSYKWLSRNYMVSSDEAKRMLQVFVQKHEGGLEVVYALSGWLKSNHPSYHVRLVTGPRLAEAQQEFDGDCSVQVYSVQSSIPKDPAVLWNAEFIQAEELFKQPSSVDNCLRDNRFCGISNSSVQRNVDSSILVSAAQQSKSIASEGPAKSNIVHQPPKNISCDSIDKFNTKPQNVVTEVKSESNGIANTVVHDNKSTADIEKALPMPKGKKKLQDDKSGSVAGGSLASLWGRASAKPKPCSPPAENNNMISNPSVSTEDGQTSAREAEECDSGNDDNHDVSLRRSSNRKRRVVFDFSDEDEDVVNLASPDFPNKQSSQDYIQNGKESLEKAPLNFDLQEENKSRVKEERATDPKAHQPQRENISAISKCTNAGKSSSEKLQSCDPKVGVNKDSVNNAAPCSPKRRKVMKTRIDERGREVTEVVWEGEETEAKKPDKVPTKKADSNAPTNAVNSAPATKKPPANSNGKGGNKKAGNKDPKQNNLLSFFKRDWLKYLVLCSCTTRYTLRTVFVERSLDVGQFSNHIKGSPFWNNHRRPSPPKSADISDGRPFWREAIIVKQLGKKVGYLALRERLKVIWRLPHGFEMVDLVNGFFVVKFDSLMDREKVVVGGEWCADQDRLKEEAMEYFRGLFCTSNINLPAISLENPVTKEQVFQALTCIKSYKAPGPHGFQPIFFKMYWHI